MGKHVSKETKLMRKRDRAYRKAKRPGSAIHWAKYRRKRNISTALLRQNHQAYVGEVMNGLCDSQNQDESDRSGVKRA